MTLRAVAGRGASVVLGRMAIGPAGSRFTEEDARRAAAVHMDAILVAMGQDQSTVVVAAAAVEDPTVKLPKVDQILATTKTTFTNKILYERLCCRGSGKAMQAAVAAA